MARTFSFVREERILYAAMRRHEAAHGCAGWWLMSRAATGPGRDCAIAASLGDSWLAALHAHSIGVLFAGIRAAVRS